MAKKKRGKVYSADSMFIITIGAIVAIVLIVSLTVLAVSKKDVSVAQTSAIVGEAHQIGQPEGLSPCKDTDNGRNYRERGYVTDSNVLRSTRNHDNCINGYILKEYYCQDDKAEFNYVNCDALLGLQCIDGACN